MAALVLFKYGLEFLYRLLSKAFKFTDKALNFTADIVLTSIKWATEILFVLGVLTCTLFFVIYASWFIIPHNLYVDLNANTQNCEIDLSNFAIEGTYVETNNGYLMKPNLPFSLPVVPKLPITKTDNTHISIIGLNFVQKKPVEIIEHPIILNPNGVYTFVPDK